MHESQVEDAQRGTESRIVFLGDSITEGWLRTGFSRRTASLPQPKNTRLFYESLGIYSPLILAIGGDRTHDLGWRLQNGLLPPQLQPSIFVILIGTNDLGTGESPGSVWAELKLLLRTLHEARPEALLAVHDIFPRGSDEGEVFTSSFHRGGWWHAPWNKHRSAIDFINFQIRNFTESHSWVLHVGCGHHFLGRAEEPSEQLEHAPEANMVTRAAAEDASATSAPPAAEAAHEYIRPELMYDLLHLTHEGYKLWATCLKGHLNYHLARARKERRSQKLLAKDMKAMSSQAL